MQAQAQIVKHDVELLNFIYQNARMGVTGINQIRGYVEDKNFLNLLNRQYAQYDQFIIQAEEAIREMGEKPQDIGAMAKTGSFLATTVNTMVDRTTSHIADMMVQGTSMGITKLTQKLNAMPDCTQQYKDIATQLIDFEVKSIDELKKFL